MTSGGSTMGISNSESTRLFPKNLWRDIKYPMGTAIQTEKIADRVHVMRLSQMENRISSL